MDLTTTLNNPAERRKQVKLRVRPDLQTYEQKYEGKTFHVVKDPVCLRYYRFNKQEHYVFSRFDGTHTMEDVQKSFEAEFTPQRLTHEDLENFARQLVTAGLVQHEQPGAGKHIFERRAKQRRLRRLATVTNILYLKLPIFDPDRILDALHKYLWWMFTTAFFVLSVAFMLSAAGFVALHFNTFYSKLPAYQEFFTFRSVLYMWLSLGVVKVIHEFGHGLSCKAFGGECHEMGVLLMCLSPALYCNVTDAWTLADKWKRIIISFAGIYVELMIAAAATYVWWYTSSYPVVNNIALCVMVLCSVSTVVFNANPLMRFDGYYILSDWLEIPNLRERANRFLNNLFLEKCLGVDVPPEHYMAPGRKVLFVAYAIGSWVYRWVVTFSVLWFLAGFLGPKLKILSQMLAVASLASVVVWPTYKVVKNIRQRGRVPDMKAGRVYATLGVAGFLLLCFFFLPLPVSRVHETGLVAVDPGAAEPVLLPEPAHLSRIEVTAGQAVRKGEPLVRFTNPKLEVERAAAQNKMDEQRASAQVLQRMIADTRRVPDSTEAERLAENFRRQEQEALTRADGLAKEVARIDKQLADLRELRAGRDGVVTVVPKREDVGKQFDRGDSQAQAFTTVAEPGKLVVRVPVSPQDFRLLKDDIGGANGLAVSVLMQSRSDRVFNGRLRRLPEQNARQVPVQLTQRGGGPLAVKDSGDPNAPPIPLAQTYLVEVELSDPDAAIVPGTLCSVKIHAKWRSAAWWLGRTLANAIDYGLY